jgi:hypothetical protein
MKHKFLGLSLALYPYLTVAAEVGQMRNWWTIDGPGFVDAFGQFDALRCFDGSANTTLACDGLVANMTSKGFNEKHGELALTQLSAIEAFTTAFKVCNSFQLTPTHPKEQCIDERNRIPLETRIRRLPTLSLDPS